MFFFFVSAVCISLFFFWTAYFKGEKFHVWPFDVHGSSRKRRPGRPFCGDQFRCSKQRDFSTVILFSVMELHHIKQIVPRERGETATLSNKVSSGANWDSFMIKSTSTETYRSLKSFKWVEISDPHVGKLSRDSHQISPQFVRHFAMWIRGQLTSAFSNNRL